MVWEELREDLIFHDVEAESYADLFRQVGGVLTDKGYGKENYVQGLIERENEFPTGLDIDGFGIAIPHTPVDFVENAATAIATLKNPVKFTEMGSDDEVEVQLVFILAVTAPKGHMDQLQRIISIIQDKEVLKKIKEETNAKEVIEIIKRKEETL